MVNQEHRIVTELKVDGVIYRETKTLTPVVTLDGKEEQEIVCTRSIGDKSYKLTRKIISTENEETYLPETTMTWEEVQAFEEDWSKNWNPVDIPTPRVSNNSWMSTFGRLFCWAGLVLVLVLAILLFLVWILGMHFKVGSQL